MLGGPATIREVFTAARLARLSDELRASSKSSELGTDAALPRENRRARGAYFTPLPLVEFVVAEALRARFERSAVEWRNDGSPRLRVLDPAAGDGRFLRAAVRGLARRAAERGHDRLGVEAAIARQCAVGIERDADFAEAARQSLGASATVHCAEALLAPPTQLARADVVVGNPPYQRSVNLSRTDRDLWQALRGRYSATSHGEWDLYAAFLEQALEWTRPGGEVGLVVPSRWLTAAFASRLRAKLAGAAAVRAIVDFGADQIFSGATTYASVVFLSREPTREVSVARLSEAGWSCGKVRVASLGAAPWKLAVGKRRALLEALSAGGPALGSVARIAKGAGTNADPVYVFDEVRNARRRDLEVYSRALGDWVRLERALLRPCLRGRDVRAFGRVGDKPLCLVPYTQDGRLLPPSELQRQWPACAAYFDRCRAPLEARERGRFRGDTFYRFGRPQNLAYLGERSAKVVVPDVARSGRAMLDTRAAFALDSTYAIRMLPDAGDWSLALVLAVLNSPIVSIWLRENGIPLRGNYVRMKTAYLQSLPLPPPSRHSRELEGLIGGAGGDSRADLSAASFERVSEVVRRAYGVDPETWGAGA